MPQLSLSGRSSRAAARGFPMLAATVMAATIIAVTGCATTASTPPRGASQSAVLAPAPPDRLADADFWQLVSDLSEPGGYFRIEDNYTSNEMEVGQLHTMLRQALRAGAPSPARGADVYVGVGPEQNFTYIAAVRPRMAFIVDIRRQAVMQHLMYKALFELAADRAEFISLLFARPRPAGVDTATPIQRLWERYAVVPSDSALARATYGRVLERLTGTHRFVFTDAEVAQLRSVVDAFVRYGPEITTRGVRGGFGATRGFMELTGFSVDSAGQVQSFLSTEANYQLVKSLHERNLIVPLSGDFGGPKTLRALGAYLTAHRATVRAFYVSNVEQYLFQDGKAAAFYANVATFPLDTASVFIRPYSMRRGMSPGLTRSLCPMAAFLRAADAGRVTSNEDALACPM